MVGVDFAISVHVNANAQSEDISGFDLDYCAQNDWSAESRVFAQALKDKLQSAYPILTSGITKIPGMRRLL